MKTYTINTDAAMGEYECASLDEAARQFAEEEGMRGINSADELSAKVEKMGGWCHFFGPDGEPAAKRCS